MVFQTVPTTDTYTPKDPNDIDLYSVDFSLILAQCNDAITGTPSISVSPSGTTFGVYGITTAGTAPSQVVFYASGGTNGIQYELDTNIITNLAPTGRSIWRTVLLPVLTR